MVASEGKAGAGGDGLTEVYLVVNWLEEFHRAEEEVSRPGQVGVRSISQH